ncbi:receptor-type tyrosine-protein phosphatase F-like isoform X3 [Corticium candelabrum]|uniref:receptor-type tyrosine-protein phosphatase F-like isoform X3 n=1 Tax=Corticium candelabrum TaxID=121492 RepID=UPI002E26B3BB|nr:receptor-type tyrosine-protein phosphatase F-like isoform X3 [Corticium candelabrum]
MQHSTSVSGACIHAVAPTISQFTAPNTNLSDSVTITCESPEAKPDPSYLFIRRQKTGEILKNTSLTKTVSYTIDKVKETDAGEYECVGENKAGLRSGTVYFTVQIAPHTLILNGQNTYTISQMDNITFRCQSTGIPVPQIRWFWDGQVQKAGEQGNGTLTITSAKKSDTATYTCEGKNDAGVDMDTVVLQVRVPPDAPTNLTAKEKANISITLSWISGSENFSPINGYEVIYRQTGSSDWMIARNFNDGATTEQLVDGLIPLTDYDFRVRARNAIGEGEFSDMEKLITHPNAPSLGPTELSYSEVKAVSAKLTWKIVNESLLSSNEGSITYYEMAYSYNNQSNMEEKLQYTNGATPSGTLTGLLKGSTYKVVVYGRNSGLYRSPPSNEVSFTTSTTVPGRVTSLGTTKVTENSLNITWEEPTDTGGQNVHIDGYRVEYRAGASGDFTIFQQNQQETMALIEGLMPRQEYTVRVTARNVNGFGVHDEIKRTARTEAPPDAPTNLTAKEKTNISITLSWISGSENFSPINGYEVTYRQTGSSDWMIARNFRDGVATEQLVDGLIPLTDYDFRVRARNAIGEGELSDIEKLITHPNAPSLGPTELSYSEVKAVSAQLTWKIVNESLLSSNEGSITYYEMAYSYNNQSNMEEKSQYTNGATPSGTLTGLLKGSTYKVVVYGRNSGLYRSPPSNEVSFTTSTTVPGKVTSLGTTEVTGNSFNVTWEEPTDTGGQNVRIDGYRVEYRAGVSGAFTIFQENQQEKTVLIEGLMPRQEYTVRVTARNGKGFGDPDEIKRTTSTEVPPDAPTNLTAKEKTNISITLSWISGSENISPINGYEVIYRQTGSSDWMIARNFSDGATTEQLVDGLMPLTDYDFRVRARNAIGEGEFSDMEKLITHPNALSLGPTELSYSEVKAVSAQLTWKIVNENLLSSNEGNITYYEMAYSYNNQSNMEEKLQYANGATPSGTLTGLLKGAAYNVVVYARNSGPYRSPPSNEVLFTTSTTVPGKVTSLGTTKVTENSLNVTWEEPTDTGGQNVRIDGYRVEYRAGVSGAFTILQENQQETMALIERLMPRQEYTVRVTARNVNGFGVHDEIKRTTSTEAVTVTIGTTTETTVQVVWQIGNVTDFVTDITVHWGTKLSETLEKGIETYTIKQLNPKTSYTIRVVVSLLNGQEREATEEVETKALTAIVLRPPETLRVDKDALGTAICLTSSGAPPPPPVEWRVNNEVVSSTGSITVQDNVLTVTYSEELNEAIIVCKVNEITSNKVTVDIPVEGKNSGLSGGTIAAIAVGVILGISIMVIILLIVMLRRKQCEVV